ncbi:MAG: selenocysteine-specific translation elongation factor [Chloroflexi bacterium]|nr:selenocysteine-specific translation elongation factor [Chloroflexota bacterium]
MRVIGTAGHVDHGKSTLVAALTGTHPDRLKEERDREMTIDLGFAWLQIPNGETIGIIDVPGHRDFIENMLAGVGGIDAALFVVAADEGVMPQTREHLAILDILQIPGGVIALTKIDLIEDPEWLELVESDLRTAVQGTVLEGAPLIRVSARTRVGLAELVDVLAANLAQTPERPDLGRPRLPVDRVFSMPGFGTVVTGTLSDGKFQVGEEVEVLPSGLKGRIRGLQTHNQKEETALPGSRTAINISGIDASAIRRGEVVAHPGKYIPTRRLDVQFRLLPDASGPLKHSSEVKLFIGATEVLGRVRTLGLEEIKPGGTGWLQLELREPVIALRGDRYILRRPSPGETLGGGLVVNPHPDERHKRFDDEVLRQLNAYLEGSPDEILLQVSEALGPASVRDVIQKSRLEEKSADAALQELIGRGFILLIKEEMAGAEKERLIISLSRWKAAVDLIDAELRAYHVAYPLRKGMPREELKSRMKLAGRVFNAILELAKHEGLLVENGVFIRLPEHEIRLSARQQEQVDRLMARFRQDPFSPPTVKECQAEVGEEVFNALIETNRLMQVSPDVVYLRDDYDRLIAEVRKHFEQNATLTVAEFRDKFHTSRRYALAFLEHADATGLTVREGDLRRLRKSPLG